MKDAVKRLNDEYRFNLSDQEIDLVTKQAEEPRGCSSRCSKWMLRE